MVVRAFALALGGLLPFTVFLACSSSSSTPDATPTAAADGVATSGIAKPDRTWRVPVEHLTELSPATYDQLLRATVGLKAQPALARLLREDDDALLADQASTSTLKSRAFRDSARAAAPLFAEVSLDSQSATRVALSASAASAALSWRRLGARAVGGALANGRLVFAEAFPSTDSVVLAGETQLEELLIIHDAHAPRSFSWKVELGPELAGLSPEPDGSLVAHTGDGVAVLRVAKPRLFDSAGGAQDLAWQWRDSRLTVELPRGRLHYPLWLDPMVETVVWQAGTAGLPRNFVAAARLGAGGGLAYGGIDTGGGTTGTTQQYSNGAWATLSPATPPGVLRQHAMAFDGTNVMMFGGLAPSTATNKTWLWSGTDWSDGCKAPCATAPSARYSHSMAYAGANKVLLFGGVSSGSDFTPSDETWEYSAGVWGPRCLACVSGTSKPTQRQYTAMAFASGTSVLLFGGLNPNTGVVNDETWLWNGTQWTQQCAACVTGTTKPIGRSRHTMSWDENRKRVVLFGGLDKDGVALDDSWEWDSANDRWMLLSHDAPALKQGAMFYDTSSKRTVMYGGSTDTDPSGATWLYHGRGSQCSTANDCNTGFCQDGKCCETACNTECRTCAGSNYGICENVGSASGVEDIDTCNNTKTCNAAGVCKSKQGQGCGAGSDCFTGSCVDGHCCESACGQACKTCNNPQGLCVNVPQFQADGGSCSGANTCDGAGACRKATGQVCGGAGECASNFCVDGRCCDGGCTGQCKSCNNVTGTCTTNVAKGTNDTNSTPACSGANTCDGAGSCKKANGQSCSAAADCASGFCADNVCCDTACDGACDECGDGSCNDAALGSAGNPSCSPYACTGNSAACPTKCANDNNCDPGYHCTNQACVADLPPGQPSSACTRSQECQGNQNCVDGFCCNADCSGACVACSNAKKGAGADATCGNIVDGAAPRAPGCQLGDQVCLADGKCDGAGGCRKFAPNTTPCGTGTTCTDNAVAGQLCDGTGFCKPGKTEQACTPSKCVGGKCNTACSADDDCAPLVGFCAGTVCASKLNDGESCGRAAECKSNNCVDGVCCNQPCEGACQTCGVGGKCTARAAGSTGRSDCTPYVCDGKSPDCPKDCTDDKVCIDTFFCKVSDNVCQPRENGTACTADDQCPDRHCVDGVCCAEACDGTCEHCDASGACVATEGAPVGKRDACPGHPDCAGSCDGERRDACTGQKAAGTSCGTPKCEANIESFGACSDDASCTETSNDCDPYVCDAEACKTGCKSDGDCKPGFSCADGSCIPTASGGVCDDAGLVLTSADDTKTDCNPYVCRAGECLRNCTDSSDCQTGFICNTSAGDGVCEAVTNMPTNKDDGGCGCRVTGGAPTPGHALPLALVGWLALARRRPRRRARASTPRLDALAL
jgi:MYXO-CTERM domain-containing protein